MSNFAISAGHKATLSAAKEVLLAGGNAVDAAIAAYWMMFVAEPCMASAGAGGFALVKMGNQISNVDFFCQTPLYKRPIEGLDFYGVDVDFGNEIETFHIGKGSSAVPGTIAGIFDMHAKWGELPMKELTSQAIKGATEGVKLDRFQALDFQLLKDIFSADPEQRGTFFNEQGIKVEGDLIRMEQYADFLTAISLEGKDLFYKGEISKKIANDYLVGGQLSRRDFEEYQVHFVNPIHYNWHNHNVYLTNLPSAGGLIIADILSQIGTQLDGAQPLSNQHFSVLEEAFKIVLNRSKDKKLLINHLSNIPSISIPQTSAHSGDQTKGTSHISIVDGEGNAIALTTSIGEGNGYFIPGTQMQMNNMLGEAALLPKGFHSWQPNTRLRSMMTPALVTDNNHDLQLVIGSGGAGRIPYAIAQTIINTFILDLGLHEATQLPRVYYDGQKTQIEEGFDVGIPKSTQNIWKEKTLFFGGTNGIQRLGDKNSAVADQRRFGVAED